MCGRKVNSRAFQLRAVTLKAVAEVCSQCGPALGLCLVDTESGSSPGREPEGLGELFL